jgi:ABC-type sugar transport system ATPase subunit
MAEVSLNGVRMVFPGGTTAVDDVTLTVNDGEFMVLVGPSGCGKSTLLRIVAGLEDATSGRVPTAAGSWTTYRPSSGTSPWCSRTTSSIRT